MNNARLPLLALCTALPGKRRRGTEWKRWTDNITEDMEEKVSNMTQAANRRKDGTKREGIHPASSSELCG